MTPRSLTKLQVMGKNCFQPPFIIRLRTDRTDRREREMTMNEKKTFETAEIRIVLLDRDLLITSGGTLAENSWDTFDFGSLGS